MDCIEKDCYEEAKGFDIERSIDPDDLEEIYIVYYRCPEGHLFKAEFTKDDSNEK